MDSRFKFLTVAVYIFLAVVTFAAERTHDEAKGKGSEGRVQNGDELSWKPTCPQIKDKDWKDKLVIHHIYVDQGDATFIRTPNGMTMLIDGGMPGKGKTYVWPVLLHCYNITSVDYLVLSHPHNDHFGGLSDLIKTPKKGSRTVAEIGDGEGPALRVEGHAFGPNPKVEKGEGEVKFNEFLKHLEKQDHPLEVPEFGTESIVDAKGKKKKVTFDIVAVNGIIKGSDKPVDKIFAGNNTHPKDANSVSVGMVIKFGKFDYLTSGDLTGGGGSTPDVETPLGKVVGDVDVAKSNHHGSKTANNPEFMKSIKAENVIVSVGIAGHNKSHFRLPDKEAIEGIAAYKGLENIWMTSAGVSKPGLAKNWKDKFPMKIADGDVLLITDGEKYSIYGEELKENYKVDEK